MFSLEWLHNGAVVDTETSLYTDVTRCKRLVVIVGQNKAVVIAVRNISGLLLLVEARRVAARRRASPRDEFVGGRLKLREPNLPLRPEVRGLAAMPPLLASVRRQRL